MTLSPNALRMPVNFATSRPLCATTGNLNDTTARSWCSSTVSSFASCFIFDCAWAALLALALKRLMKVSSSARRFSTFSACTNNRSYSSARCLR